MPSAINTSGPGLNGSNPILSVLSELQDETYANFVTAKAEITALQAVSGGLADLNALTDVTVATPSNNQVLTYDSGTSQWKNANNVGENNTMVNVGTGSGVYKEKAGVELRLKSILAGTGITVTGNTNDVTIATTAEANTAANVGSGVGVYKEKAGVELRLKSLVAGAGIEITGNTNDITIVATGSGGGDGEANTASNAGAGAGVYKTKSGVDLVFKSLVAGVGMSITEGTDELTLTPSGAGSAANTIRYIGSSVDATALNGDWIAPGWYRYDAGLSRYVFDYTIQGLPYGEDLLNTDTFSFTDAFGRSKCNIFVKVISGAHTISLPVNVQGNFINAHPYAGLEGMVAFLIYPGSSVTFNRGSGAVLYDLTRTNVSTLGTLSGYLLVQFITKGTTWWRLT